jgi:hypothetical protein
MIGVSRGFIAVRRDLAAAIMPCTNLQTQAWGSRSVLAEADPVLLNAKGNIYAFDAEGRLTVHSAVGDIGTVIEGRKQRRLDSTRSRLAGGTALQMDRGQCLAPNRSLDQGGRVRPTRTVDWKSRGAETLADHVRN